MSGKGVDFESTVSGNQADTPARPRRAPDIDDGYKLRWRIEDDAWGVDDEWMPRALTDTTVLFAAAYRRDGAQDDALPILRGIDGGASLRRWVSVSRRVL